jgi:hypothetical protein
VDDFCLHIQAFASSRGQLPTTPRESPDICLLVLVAILVLSLRFEVGWSWQAIKRPKEMSPSGSVTREAVLYTRPEASRIEGQLCTRRRIARGKGEVDGCEEETCGGDILF